MIVGVGGDEACSLASYISRTWCGGVSCALVPTTLDAMIRCSTQMTPLPVSGGSLVSLEPDVSLVVCDLALVGDRPIEENGQGYALMCGTYLSESRACWDGFGTVVRGIVEKNETSLSDALSTTLTARLNIAKSVSPSARRALLFGHTTASPFPGVPSSASSPRCRSSCATSRWWGIARSRRVAWAMRSCAVRISPRAEHARIALALPVAASSR